MESVSKIHNGRRGSGEEFNVDGELVKFLYDLFQGSIDVQCEAGDHCHLRYVTGYCSKASDAMNFNRQEAHQSGGEKPSRWFQIYRMMVKQCPLEHEMTIHMATLPLTLTSFSGEFLYAPIPRANREEGRVNNSQKTYLRYLAAGKAMRLQSAVDKKNASAAHGSADIKSFLDRGVSFLQWARTNIKRTGEPAAPQYLADVNENAKRKGGRAAKSMCAIGIKWPFELLDIYIGAWCAVFVPHFDEQEFVPPADCGMPSLSLALRCPVL